MKKCMLALFVLALTAGFLIQFTAQVFAGPNEDVQAAMQLLKSKAAKLGAPSINGEEAVAGKVLPALHFGATKMNNNFILVDEVQKEMGGTATIFVKSGGEFVWAIALSEIRDDNDVHVRSLFAICRRSRPDGGVSRVTSGQKIVDPPV